MNPRLPTFDFTVRNGFPVTIRYDPTLPHYGYDWEILTRKGRPAPWIGSNLHTDDPDRIIEACAEDISARRHEAGLPLSLKGLLS